MIELVCYIVSLVLFILAAIGIPTSRFSLIAAGLAFWILGEHIIGAVAR
jgi:hypothetical protein